MNYSNKLCTYLQTVSPTCYSYLNTAVPILQLYFDEAADLRCELRLSQQSIKALITALKSNSKLRRVIAFPTADDLEAVGAGFAQLVGSPSFCVAGGARDSCHIRIKPPANNSQCYFSRKLFHSVLLQDITSHQGNFMEIFVWYRGSVLDARVLKNSPVYTGRLYPPAGRCLVRRTWLREPLGCSKHAGAPSKSCLHARSCCVLCGAPQSLIARGSQSCSVRIHQPLPHCHGLCVNVYLATVLLNSMTDACVIVQFFKL